MIKPNVQQDIDEIAKDLHSRIQEETERLLKSQLESMGVGGVANECGSIHFPLHNQKIADYYYNGTKILGVRIANSQMAIEFDIPKLTKETQGGSE